MKLFETDKKNVKCEKPEEDSTALADWVLNLGSNSTKISLKLSMIKAVLNL